MCPRRLMAGILSAALVCLLSLPSHAFVDRTPAPRQSGSVPTLDLPHKMDDTFGVKVNGIPYSGEENIMPCFPVKAVFTHNNPHVVKVRMQYPEDQRRFKDLPLDVNVPLTLHENFMKDGEYSYSDFIAMDNFNNEYGRVRLTFMPPHEPFAHYCEDTNS